MFSVNRMRTRLNDDPRLARMLRGGASGIAGRGLGILVSLVTLPLTVRYLGPTEYGVWVTISTTVVMLSVLDLGIANTLTNFISEAFSRDDRVMAQSYFATAFWLTVLITCVIGAGGALVWRWVDWGALFHLEDPLLVMHARVCVAISLGFFLVSLPLNLANRVLGGYQQVHISNYFAMGNSVLGLIAIITVVAVKGTIIHLMIGYCAAMLTGTVAMNVWLFAWQKPWISPTVRKVERSMVQALFTQGFLFFVVQITGLVVFNSDNLVITHYLGAAEVTPYNVAWKLISYATMLQTLLIPSLWPAFTEAYHKGELAWVRKTYRAVMRKGLLAVGLAALCIAIGGRSVVRVWAGNVAVPSRTLLWSMACWGLLVSVTTNQALLLTATNRLRRVAAVAVLAAVLNLILSISLVSRMGSEGVILGTILSFLVAILGPQEWEVRRVLSGVYRGEAMTGELPEAELLVGTQEGSVNGW